MLRWMLIVFLSLAFVLALLWRLVTGRKAYPPI